MTNNGPDVVDGHTRNVVRTRSYLTHPHSSPDSPVPTFPPHRPTEHELAQASARLESHELRCMLRRMAADSTFADCFQVNEWIPSVLTWCGVWGV